MQFELSSDQESIVQLARNLARDEWAPEAARWDAEHIFPKDTLRHAATLGLAAMYIKEDVGGAGLTRLDAALIISELAAACPSTAAFLSIHNMVTWMCDTYGSEEIRQQWIPRLAKMDLFASYCLTEPNAGSDAAALQTSALLTGDHYLVNGSKAFISGGGESDLYAVMVRTGVEGPKGISCLLVPKDTPGLSFGKQEIKLGWHSQPTSMVFFENCRIPVRMRLGNEGQGFNIALSALNGGRVNIAACSLGGAKACIALARAHVLERRQFQQPLAALQSVQFKLADSLTEWESAKWMVLRAADSLDKQHPEAPLFCAMAKRHATDVGFRITNDCLQLFGGYGYLQDYPIERYFRDLRVHQILEGTNEIMRLIIAKQFFAETFSMESL